MYDITQKGVNEILAWVDAHHNWPGVGEFWVLDARPANMIVSPDEIFKI